MTLKNPVTWLPQRSSFRTPLDSQSLNGSEILLKPARQNFYPNFVRQTELENISLSQIWNLRTLFWHFNGLSHVLSSELREIPATSSHGIISKTTKIFRHFHCVFGICIKSCIFWRKGSPSDLNSFRSYWLRRMQLLDCLKDPISEHPSAVNELMGPKHSWNLQCRGFIAISY